MAAPKYKPAFQFTVEGKGEFPLDMLRYDCCWPYAQEDVAEITCSSSKGVHRVVLTSASYRPNVPTTERWESFGWRVVGLGIHRRAHSEVT